MPIFLTLKSVPELAHLSSSERGKVWRRVYRKTFRHGLTWIGMLACMVFSIVGHDLGSGFSYPRIGGAIGAGLGGLISFQVAISVARRYYKNDLLGGNPS